MLPQASCGIVIANVQPYEAISQEWYQFVPKLLSNMNIKSYLSYRMVSSAMTSSVQKPCSYCLFFSLIDNIVSLCINILLCNVFHTNAQKSPFSWHYSKNWNW